MLILFNTRIPNLSKHLMAHAGFFHSAVQPFLFCFWLTKSHSSWAMMQKYQIKVYERSQAGVSTKPA